MISPFTPSLSNLSISYLSICIPPSRNHPSRLLGQLDNENIKNSSAFRNYDRRTGIWQDDRQEYDRQRTLDEYMIDSLHEGKFSIFVVFWDLGKRKVIFRSYISILGTGRPPPPHNSILINKRVYMYVQYYKSCYVENYSKIKFSLTLK